MMVANYDQYNICMNVHIDELDNETLTECPNVTSHKKIKHNLETHSL